MFKGIDDTGINEESKVSVEDEIKDEDKSNAPGVVMESDASNYRKRSKQKTVEIVRLKYSSSFATELYDGQNNIFEGLSSFGRLDVAEDNENLFSCALNTVVDEIMQEEDNEYRQGRDIEGEDLCGYEMLVDTTQFAKII